MEALTLEIEREKFDYLEKSKHLQDQLQTFKSEIDELKLDEKVTELDKIHSQQRTEGENKYSTIQKVSSFCLPAENNCNLIFLQFFRSSEARHPPELLSLRSCSLGLETKQNSYDGAH